MELLSVDNVNKKFDKFELDNISFTLEPGYIMGYIGQNGAGKTTTLNIITHLLKCDTGVIKIDGIEYDDDPIHYKEMIGYVGDESYLPMEFTLKDIKNVLRSFYKSFKEDVYDSYINKWKLPNDVKIKEYSKGMKVRLMFACVLSRNSKLLILDEATNGLDPVVKEEVLEIVQEYIEDGTKSVLFSTHIISDLEQIADYIFFIDDGKKLLLDSKDELLEKYMIIKGGNDELTEELKRKIIGIKKTKVGFEGLIKADDATNTTDCVIEKTTVEQMMVHLIMEGGRVDGRN